MVNSQSLRVCLVEWILGRMKKKKKKFFFFWRVFVWEGEREKRWCLGVFSQGPTKIFLPKMGRKLRGENVQVHMDENAYVHLHMGWFHVTCFFLFSFFFQFSCFVYHFFFSSTCTYKIFLPKKCYFFILFNENIILNLY